MTNEVRQELVDAFNRGWTGEAEPKTPLDRLRLDWSEATEAERRIFKKEILP